MPRTRRPSPNKKKPATQVVIAGQDKKRNAGVVNTPVYRASTVLFDSIAAMNEIGARHRRGEKVLYYGRRGTPTHWTLREAMTELEGGADTFLTPSGLSACTIAILGCVKAGDHLLVTDSVYEPTRVFCDGVLKEFGIDVSYYPPTAGRGIARLFRDNTTAVFCESPGSHTFEVQDLPAIAAAAHARGAKVIADNTWATPLFCRPLDLGCDVSVHAATKYIVGHSDAMVGTITVNAAALPRMKRVYGALGVTVGPDEVYFATRGIRTLVTRLERHQANAMAVARWLTRRPEVKRVLYPPLPSDPGHRLWKRDFRGGSGLLGIVFKRTSQKAVTTMVDGMTLFPLGYSWGGFESLICPTEGTRARTAAPWTEPVPGIRLHIGLEDPDDLIADLDAGLKRFRAAL